MRANGKGSKYNQSPRGTEFRGFQAMDEVDVLTVPAVRCFDANRLNAYQ